MKVGSADPYLFSESIVVSFISSILSSLMVYYNPLKFYVAVAGKYSAYAIVQ
jgi:hypothetical protein